MSRNLDTLMISPILLIRFVKPGHRTGPDANLTAIDERPRPFDEHDDFTAETA
jgi:hypothetical protein